ncbi:MAG TPA: glycosyltransferase family 4 protein [Lacunisphaera sp.]|nr:glycosyltransferase family 4 protein [Lacunisphaera sp.]
MLAIITSHPIQYQAPLWRELARAGVKFEVWFLTRHAVEASFDREFGRTFAWDVKLLEGYPHRFLPVEEGWRLDRFLGIKLRADWADEFRQHGVTHVWVEGWRFAEFWRAVQAARACGLQVWLRGESHHLAPESGWRRFLKRQALGRLFRRVDRFLCIGSANRRFYLRHGIAESRLSSAPYCVDNDRFAAAAEELRPRRAELRSRWGIAPGAYVVLFCGKLIPKKRPLDLLAAARPGTAFTRRPLHLLFAGDGELAPALREALAAPGAPPGTITGFLNQTEIPDAFAAADCLVLPSDYGETWGLVVNEALASGLPAITSDRCGCAEGLALPQGPAHVYACGDVAGLAQALQQVADRPPAPEMLRLIVDAHAPRRTVETVQQLIGAAANT